MSQRCGPSGSKGKHMQQGRCLVGRSESVIATTPPPYLHTSDDAKCIMCFYASFLTTSPISISITSLTHHTLTPFSSRSFVRSFIHSFSLPLMVKFYFHSCPLHTPRDLLSYLPPRLSFLLSRSHTTSSQQHFPSSCVSSSLSP